MSLHNGLGNTTFFTEANILSPKAASSKQRPSTAGASRTLRVKLSRTTSEAFADDNMMNLSQVSTTNKTTLTRPMSISLRLQEDRDLRWMRVQESSLTRSEERDQHFRSKVAQYEARVRKIEKTEKEERDYQLDAAHAKQIKRDSHFTYKQDIVRERETAAY
jgi:hypothetical protein